MLLSYYFRLGTKEDKYANLWYYRFAAVRVGMMKLCTK